MVVPPRIELGSPVPQTGVLPLNYGTAKSPGIVTKKQGITSHYSGNAGGAGNTSFSEVIFCVSEIFSPLDAHPTSNKANPNKGMIKNLYIENLKLTR